METARVNSEVYRSWRKLYGDAHCRLSSCSITSLPMLLGRKEIWLLVRLKTSRFSRFPMSAAGRTSVS